MTTPRHLDPTPRPVAHPGWLLPLAVACACVALAGLTGGVIDADAAAPRVEARADSAPSAQATGTPPLPTPGPIFDGGPVPHYEPEAAPSAPQSVPGVHIRQGQRTAAPEPPTARTAGATATLTTAPVVTPQPDVLPGLPPVAPAEPTPIEPQPTEPTPTEPTPTEEPASPSSDPPPDVIEDPVDLIPPESTP